MLGWRSSGSRPAPSTGAGWVVANGLARKIVIDAKNAPNPSSTAVAYGTTSRRAFRVRKIARLDQSESSSSQSRSDPSWEDQTAAAL